MILRILSQTLFLFFCSVPCHHFSISPSFSYYCRKRRNRAALIMCFRAELGIIAQCLLFQRFSCSFYSLAHCFSGDHSRDKQLPQNKS
uniref:Secreted protein n=1 Tax=Cairina moschata TaxID=8855 RepID=A0A8C3C8J8_CAIMO